MAVEDIIGACIDEVVLIVGVGSREGAGTGTIELVLLEGGLGINPGLGDGTAGTGPADEPLLGGVVSQARPVRCCKG